MKRSSLLLATTLTALALWATPASAGIDACGNIRLEDVGSCEVRGSVECTGGCSELGVYEKACATKLHTVCREDCTLVAEPTCTDECTTMCEGDCNAGINVICIHNCFGECTGSCEAHCTGSANHGQCIASCEANCDGECDIKCEPVVDASCYQHCVECCGGSCSAQANMDCQTSCQEEQFEQCEYELKADCELACSGDGALFCDGEYVISGSELPGCVAELIAEGIGSLEAEVDVEIGPDGAVAEASAGGCSVTGVQTGAFSTSIGLLAAAFGWLSRRRRSRSARRA